MQQQPQERRNSAGALNAPGAYKMPGQPSRNGQRFYVTIPRGVRPGQHFRVLVNGEQLMVRCPDGMRPGDRLIVTSPRERPQQYVVQVPNGVRPGQQFPVQIQNQQIMVTCPNVSLHSYIYIFANEAFVCLFLRNGLTWLVYVQGVRPGERVTFNLPRTQPAAPPTAPNHQMFEVRYYIQRTIFYRSRRLTRSVFVFVFFR